LELYLCTVDYIIENFKPKICLVGRNTDNKRYVIKRDFFPYCYIDKNFKKALAIQEEDYTFENTNLKVAKGGEVIKVYGKYPSRIGNLNRMYGELLPVYEADILFGLRYIIDKGIITGFDFDGIIDNLVPIDMKTNLYKVYIDIETLSEDIPDTSKGDASVIVFGMYDTLGETYHIWVNSKQKTLNLSNELTTEPKNIKLHFFESEKDMLENILDYIAIIEPDVFITFTLFDMGYFVARCRNLGINCSSLSPLDLVRFRGGILKISGAQIFDLADGYRVVVGASKWETLHDISMKELGYGRKYHEEPVFETWGNNPVKVIIRNLIDVELTKELDKECNILVYFETIKDITGCNLNDGFLTSRIGDILYLRKNYGRVVLPIRTTKARKTYTGAVVFPSQFGIYENMLVLDWKQMYPSIIRTWNIGWETYREDGSGDLSIDGKWTFVSSPKSWTVEILDDLQPLGIINKEKQRKAEKNKEWKRKKLLEKEMWGLKSIINGVYGLFGFAGDWRRQQPAARLYNYEIASAITYVGRELQKAIQPIVEKLGYKLVYGDTDSVFIQLKTKNPLKESEKLQKLIGKEMRKFIQKRWNIKTEILMLDVDKIFKKVILLAKKRYTGFSIYGEKIVKGLDIVRRNTPEITIDIQKKVIDIICGNNPKDAIGYIKETIDKFRNKEFPIEYISMPVKLSKKANQYKPFTPQLQAFLFAKDYLNLKIREGERFYMIYVKDVPPEFNKIVIFPSKYKKKILDRTCPATRNKVNTCKNKFKTVERVIKHIEINHINLEKKIRWKPIKCIGFKNVNDIPKGVIIDYNAMEEKILKKKLEDFVTLLGEKWDVIIAGKTLDGYLK